MTERALNATVFTGRLRGSLGVLLSALFILDCFTPPPPAPFFHPQPRDVYYRGVYSRGRRRVLNKIRE